MSENLGYAIALISCLPAHGTCSIENVRAQKFETLAACETSVPSVRAHLASRNYLRSREKLRCIDLNLVCGGPVITTVASDAAGAVARQSWSADKRPPISMVMCN